MSSFRVCRQGWFDHSLLCSGARLLLSHLPAVLLVTGAFFLAPFIMRCFSSRCVMYSLLVMCSMCIRFSAACYLHIFPLRQGGVSLSRAARKDEKCCFCTVALRIVALLELLALCCFSTTFRSISLPLRAVFHTYFRICWNFTALSQIVHQIHVKITLFLGLFQAYRQRSNFSFLRCAKNKIFDMIRHASSLTDWTFPENPQRIQLFPHVLALKNDDCNNHRLCVLYAEMTRTSRTGFFHFFGL